MKSIIHENKELCYLCGNPAYRTECGIMDQLEKHHVFGGNPGRKLSERYGLTVYLHGIKCHREGKDSVHRNSLVAGILKAEAQRRFEMIHGSRKEFMEIFGKNYI